MPDSLPRVQFLMPRDMAADTNRDGARTFRRPPLVTHAKRLDVSNLADNEMADLISREAPRKISRIALAFTLFTRVHE